MPITTTPSGGPQGEFSTYTPIYSTTLSASTGSVTFSDIPSTYTDLRLVVHQKNSQVGGTAFNGEDMWLRFNGDTSTNYSITVIEGHTTPPPSGTNANQTKISLYSMSLSQYIPFLIDIQNYANATTHKTCLFRNSNTSNVVVGVGSWRKTPEPITSITLTMNTSVNNFASGSTFTIYGIKAAAPAPKATGGDYINTDGTYWYHAFKTTGLFDVKTPITADYLVVAGGGGGGANANDRGSGGGGAGGYRTATSQSLTVQSYPVVVGAGGVAQSLQGSGTKGGNSSFNGMSSTGGGFGTNAANTGGTGGSGGGSSNGGTGSAGNATGGAGNEGGYTPVEGYAGGNSIKNNDGYNGGGGGGAGGVGANASAYSSADTAGGVGVAPGSTWSLATGTGVSGYYAAGGAGAGATRTGNRTAAPANTGNGGAGNAQSYRAGFGGSGIVIVRYPV